MPVRARLLAPKINEKMNAINTALNKMILLEERDGGLSAAGRCAGENAAPRKKRKMNSALLSSKKMDYCTPQSFFDTLNAEFHFTLDAAATEKSAKCKNFYTLETDGLTAPWNIGGGSAFCNPPYGRALGAWVRKAYEEAQAGTTVVLLIPARTDTAYFHDYIYGKAEIRFLRGRLHFEDEDGNRFPPAPFPSMVVIYNGGHQCLN